VRQKAHSFFSFHFPHTIVHSFLFTEEDSLLKEAIADTKMQNRWLHRTNLLIGGGLLLLVLVVYGSNMQHEQPTAALANLPKEGDPLTDEEWAKVHEYWAQNPVDFSGVDLPTSGTCTISLSAVSFFLWNTVAIQGCCGDRRRGWNFGWNAFLDLAGGALSGVGMCTFPPDAMDEFYESSEALVRSVTIGGGGWNIVFTNTRTGRKFYYCNGGSAGSFVGSVGGKSSFKRNVLADAMCNSPDDPNPGNPNPKPPIPI